MLLKLIKSGLSLLFSDSIPFSEEIIEESSKPLSIIKEHFTFTGNEITKAYQDSYGYAITAITVGLAAPEQKWVFVQKILNSKVTRDFADPIEPNYWKPFIEKQRFSDEECSDLRHKFINQLNTFAKYKDNLFQINQFAEGDLAALINYQRSPNLSELVLQEMRQKLSVEDTLAAFLSQNDLLAKAILYFFHDIIRQDERVAKTQAALQQEGLIKSVQDIETAIQTAQEKANQANASQSKQLTEISEQLQNLKQAKSAWQTHNEFLTEFDQQFPAWRDLLNHQVEHLLKGVEDISEKLEKVHDDVKEIKAVQTQILEMLTLIASQIKPSDELTVHNNTNLNSLIEDTVTKFEQLPTENPKYSEISIMVGSALSLTDTPKKAEPLFQQAIDNANNDEKKALAQSAYQDYLDGKRLKLKKYVDNAKKLLPVESLTSLYKPRQVDNAKKLLPVDSLTSLYRPR